MRKVKIHVKKEEIAKGKASYVRSCPVALAVKRTLGKTASIGEHYGTVGWMDFYLPPAVRLFIQRFDLGIPVKPITFTLELPNENPIPPHRRSRAHH